MFKCAYSDTHYSYDREYDDLMKATYTAACTNDPHFYQMCDLEFAREMGWKMTDDEVLCGSYLCDRRMDILTSFRLTELGEECSSDCRNTDLNIKRCEDEEVRTLPSGKVVSLSKICNDVCDIGDCEDEANCNGFTYGMYCKSGLFQRDYIEPKYICDAASSCDQKEDNAHCAVTKETETSCRHVQTGSLVPVHNNTRCTVLFHNLQKYCIDKDTVLYQTNCSDSARIGLRCEINGYMSSVSKYIVCNEEYDKLIEHHGLRVCDDKIEKRCFETKTCKIHKHKMCNNKTDCVNEADELHDICRSMTNNTCQRRADLENGELPIPTKWIKDGVMDCVNGVDETADWPICGRGKTIRYFLKDYDKCENVFLCRTGDPGYVELNKLCDGLDTCGNENEVCSVSSRSYSITTSVLTTNKGLSKTLSYCMKGLQTLRQLQGSCIDKQFIYPDGEIFGVDTKTSLTLPYDKKPCAHLYGEQYLYTSCTGRCIDEKASCPLKTPTRYEVCPNQFPNRVGTIVNNKYLIFFTRSFGTIYTNRYFVCEDRKKCISYPQVCNLVHDCEDRSDEKMCTNHFKCNSSQHLLPKTKKCDGRIDCADLSDECNEECSNTILEGALIEGLSWTIGIIAVTANLAIIGKSLWTLKRCRTAVAVMNRCFIIMIAFGDFLIGCYLTVIAIYDTIIHEEYYCKKQMEWITSFECSAIGVLSTIGSQVSLFSMAGLSIVRIHGIRNSMNIPGEVTGSKILNIATTMLILISASVAIAILPIVKIFEDFYVNALQFSDKLKIFIGTTYKATVFKVIQAYYGRTKETTLKWEKLIEMVRGMFSRQEEYEDFTEEINKVDFFGNDGVCLFKYFVKNEDPQRMFVWSILALNFTCFMIIAFSYLLIGILSQRSSESLAMSQNNQQIAQRNKRMNRRIAIIITTDFLCWIPFITTCILHSLEVVDATPWYSIFSMIILPINSVINPLLYDGAITNASAFFFCSLSARISESAIGNYLTTLATTGSSQCLNRLSNSVILQAAREWLNPSTTEAVELDVIENHAQHFEGAHTRETES